MQYMINKQMILLMLEATQDSGEGSLSRKQQKLLKDIETLKHSMFDDAKNEVLRQSKELMVLYTYIYT